MVHEHLYIIHLQKNVKEIHYGKKFIPFQVIANWDGKTPKPTKLQYNVKIIGVDGSITVTPPPPDGDCEGTARGAPDGLVVGTLLGVDVGPE